MTDLRRLLEEPGDELELELLRAARDDGPPAASLWKAAAALGVGAAATGAVGLGASPALASAAAEVVPGTGAALAKGSAIGATKGMLGGLSLSIGAFVKPLAVGVAAGIAASAGVVHYTSERDDALRTPAIAGETRANAGAAPARERSTPATSLPLDARAAEAETPPRAAPAAVESTPSTAPGPARRAVEKARVEAPVAAPEPAPAAAFAAPEEPPKPEVVAPKTAPARSLGPEVALLDRARSALVGHDASAALAALDAYDGAPRSGVFEPEAAVLRIQARLMLGDRAGAAELARRFVAAHPGSRHAQSLQALADEAKR